MIKVVMEHKAVVHGATLTKDMHGNLNETYCPLSTPEFSKILFFYVYFLSKMFNFFTLEGHIKGAKIGFLAPFTSFQVRG